jgi:hypothetical protein
MLANYAVKLFYAVKVMHSIMLSNSIIMLSNYAVNNILIFTITKTIFSLNYKVEIQQLQLNISLN